MNRPTTLLIAVATLAIAGCGSNGSHTVPNVASTTTTTVASAASILNDYRAFWDDYLAVTNPMTPGNPRIATHATDDELKQLNGLVIAENQNHRVYRGSIEPNPTLTNSTSDSAVVTDCLIDKTGSYSTDDGSRKDKDDLTPQNLQVKMINIGGIWKVATIDHRSEPCTP